MKRLALAAMAVVSIGIVTTPAGAQTTVTPGAFCSPLGGTGVTTAGLAMVCSLTPTDTDRARWRDASTAGLITAGDVTTTAPVSTTAAATTTTTRTAASPSTTVAAAATFPKTGDSTEIQAIGATLLLVVGAALAYRTRRTPEQRAAARELWRPPQR